jgi:dihydropteroate synthase
MHFESKHNNNQNTNKSMMASAPVYDIGNKLFDFNKSYVMGILNVTPDSFSDGGSFYEKEKAVSYGLKMLEDGADIIDIGGESTRPGAAQVTADEELNRVIPVIEEILQHRPNTIISIDTTKQKVAETALKSGAKIVNDISGLTFEPGLANIISKYDAAVIIMHMKGTPKTMQINPFYDDVVSEVYDYFVSQTDFTVKSGINKIFIDPGIGFGKRLEDNLTLINNLSHFLQLNYPIVIGLSRKSFIGKILNLEPAQRDEASAILNAIAISNGARIIRTHNVKAGVQTCKLLNEIV